jgi:hypothetical protein
MILRTQTSTGFNDKLIKNQNKKKPAPGCADKWAVLKELFFQLRRGITGNIARQAS